MSIKNKKGLTTGGGGSSFGTTPSSSRLILKNLPKYLTSTQLLSHLNSLLPSCRITDCRLMTKPSGRSRCFAFVGFHTTDEADYCRRFLTNAYIHTIKVEADWAKTRQETAKEQDESMEQGRRKRFRTEQVEKSKATPAKEHSDNKDCSTSFCSPASIDLALSTGRLMVTNLPYMCQGEDLRFHFTSFGQVAEAHVVRDEDTTRSRGLGFVLFVLPEDALKALRSEQVLQGRRIVVQGAEDKKKSGPSQEIHHYKKGLSSFKRHKQAIQKDQSIHHQEEQTWNLLYVSSQTAADHFASKVPIKSQKLNVRDSSLATKIALYEAKLVQKNKRWLRREGIAVRAFERHGNDPLYAKPMDQDPHQQWVRSDTTIIVKNLPIDVTLAELHDLFSQTNISTQDPFAPSNILRCCLAPSKTVAVVEFAETRMARRAFRRLAFRKLRNRLLLLEWAPSFIFQGKHQEDSEQTSGEESGSEDKSFIINTEEACGSTSGVVPDKVKSGNDQKANDQPISKQKGQRRIQKRYFDMQIVEENHRRVVGGESSEAQVQRGPAIECDSSNGSHSSIFVKNLNFKTTEETLTRVFEGGAGFCKVVVMKKLAPAKKGEQNKSYLSMGYGFVEFNSKENAQEGVKLFQGVTVDERTLELSLAKNSMHSRSATGYSALANRELEEANDVSTKLIVKNLPFEASKSDLHRLFSTQANVTSVRVPKNSQGRSRGYGFVEFLTRSDALNALEVLQHTHLYGRHLILQGAEGDVVTVEDAAKKSRRETGSVIISESKKRRVTNILQGKGKSFKAAFEMLSFAKQ